VMAGRWSARSVRRMNPPTAAPGSCKPRLDSLAPDWSAARYALARNRLLPLRNFSRQRKPIMPPCLVSSPRLGSRRRALHLGLL